MGPIETHNFETVELFCFFLFMLIVVYTTRLCLYCQVTALILEQFRKIEIMQTELIKKRYAKYRIKNMPLQWVKSTC